MKEEENSDSESLCKLDGDFGFESFFKYVCLILFLLLTVAPVDAPGSA